MLKTLHTLLKIPNIPPSGNHHPFFGPGYWDSEELNNHEVAELDSYSDPSGSRDLSPVDMAHSSERVLDFKTKSRENLKPF